MTARWWPVMLENSCDVDLGTEAAGVLRCQPGNVSASFQLAFKERDEKEHVDVLSCCTRLTDSEGTVWEAEAAFTPHVFMEKLIDLRRLECHQFFTSAEERWKQAFKKARVLAEIRDFHDDRFYRHFLVDTALVHLHFKYLCPQYDVAHLDARYLLVRVRGLWTSWESLVWDEGMAVGVREPLDEEEGVTWGDVEELPPLVYRLDTHHLLFRDTAYLENPKFRIWRDNDIPRPLRFRRRPRRAEPQEHVRFLPFAGP